MILMRKHMIRNFEQLNAACARHVESHGAQYVVFGIFAVINYIIPYFMWSPSANDNYELLIFLRLIAGSMCFLLIIKDYWRSSLLPYLPLYWYLTLFYCLPFLTTFMVLDSKGDYFWLLNLILALLLLAVLVDWQSFIIILTMGVTAGYGFFVILGNTKDFSFSSDTLYWTTYMCFFSVLIGILFSRKNEKITKEKLSAYKNVSTSIAHEMRTPLSSMYISAQGVQRYLPKLLTTYGIANENNLSIPMLSEKELKILDDFPKHLSSISRRSLSIIDIFLTNFGAFDKQRISLYRSSISECVERSIIEYPFFSDSQRSIVNYQRSTDFIFLGNEDLMIHIMANLLKNSLYQIQIAQKGCIDIWLSENPSFNILHFRDTASGIRAADLTRIFDKFYSGTSQGTGIGLSYCKQAMTLFGGQISCCSRFGEYTEMQLFFPKIKE